MDDAQAAARQGHRPIHPGIEPYLMLPVWKLGTALLQREGFEDAVWQYCRAMVEPSSFRWPSNKIFAQKMRYLTCYMLIGLERRARMGLAPAPSISDLQAVVPGSSRQVSDLIAGLRAGGYVLAERSASDRRSVELRATPALVQEVARSPLAFLAASECLLPPASSLEGRLRADPVMLADVVGLSVMHYQERDALFGPFATVVDFTGRDSGYLILTAVMGAHLSQSTGRIWDLPLSYDALAQRFHVSRQHVGNVLAHAARSGVFITRAGQLQSISPAFVTEFATWSAGQMAHYRMLAETSLASDLQG